MSSTDAGRSEGVGLSGLLFVALLVLKLLHKIDWSWWWVTAPLWVPFVLVIIAIAMVATVAALRR